MTPMDATFSQLRDGLISADMLDVRGIYPSVCIIEATPQDFLDSDSGTLTFSDAGMTREWHGCAVNRASMRYHSSKRGITMSFQVLDRRWKWKQAVFSGMFNPRGPDGQLISSRKTNARELGTILLRALGEANAIVDGLPTNVWPTVDWQCINTAIALDRLCDMCGCAVVLGDDDRVRIVVKGEGEQLPDNDQVRHLSSRWNTGRIPKRVVLCCGPTMWQYTWPLEAVGIELDGDVKKVEDLDYKPDTWAHQWWCSFPGVTGQNAWAAHQTVWRWFRVKVEQISHCPEPITDLWQILPLEDWVFDPVTEDFDENAFRSTCYITGNYWMQGDFQTSSTNSLYPAPFTVLKDKGIVETDYPVVSFGSSGTIQAPTLYLTTTSRIKYRDGTGDIREILISNIGGTGKDVLLNRFDLYRAVSTSVDTGNDVRSEANAHLDAYCRQFAASEAEEREYAGLVPVSLDGAICQARYRAGGLHALTNISRNMEFDVFSRDAVSRQRMAAVDAITGGV